MLNKSDLSNCGSYLFVRGGDALQVEGIEDTFSSDDQSFPSLIQ